MKPIPPPHNPQDELALLTEDLRVGFLCRPIVQKNGPPKFEPVQSGVRIDDVPVFILPPLPLYQQDVEAVSRPAADALGAGSLRMPYPRSLFLIHVEASHPGLQAPAAGALRGVEHNYAMLVEERAGGWDVTTYMHHPSVHNHWALQSLNAKIDLGNTNIIIDADDFCGALRPGTKERTHCDWVVAKSIESLKQRLEWMLYVAHRMTGEGQARARVTAVPGGPRSEKIGERRRKLKLPPINPVRLIDLDAPIIEPAADPDDDNPNPNRPKGKKRSPHFRRAVLATLKSGKQVWRPPCAIHKEAGLIPPPWYEIRALPRAAGTDRSTPPPPS